MTVAEYVWKHLESIGVTYCFYVSGGSIMWLVDALHKSNIKAIHMLHEQAAVIAADGYAQYKNELGVALVCGGPGATNAITACAASYIDSTPLLIISGQCKTADIEDGQRSKGCQEVGILSMVKDITKYTKHITHNLNHHNFDIMKKILEKAIDKATTERKGPVWLEIPIDVQGQKMEERYA